MSWDYVNGIIVNTDSFQDHSITFGDGTLDTQGRFAGKNTWRDWHLIPTTRPVVAQAGISTSFVDIPGRRNGSIDMTDSLTGHVIYGARSGSFQFIVDNDHEYWETIRSKIVSYLHGKRMKMCLEDEPYYYYEGRFSLSEMRSEASYSTITIGYALEPYKKTNSNFHLLSGSTRNRNIYLDYPISLSGGEKIKVRILSWNQPVSNRTSIAVHALGTPDNVKLGTISINTVPSEEVEFTVPVPQDITYIGIRVHCRNAATIAEGQPDATATALLGFVG